jgi:hypothetical protein
LLTRAWLRDIRFRLSEIIRLRTEAGAPLGELPAALAGAPDPEAWPAPVFSEPQLHAIDSSLTQTGMAADDPARPPDPLRCGLDCHVANLFWDLRHGRADIDATLARLDVTKVSEGIALNLVGILIKNRFYEDNGIDYATQQCLEGFGALDLPQEIAGYKPRPLEGVWATAPFLHNGSVPTLYQMLLPPAKRDTKFFVGRREYDPVHVGFVTTPDADGDDDGFWLDTSIPGNHNTGHAFAADAPTWARHLQNPAANPLPSGVIGPEFTDDERFAIVEYLKTHRDLPATPDGYQPPQCRLHGRDF